MTFWGYTFRPRRVRTRTGRSRLGFTPAISRKAMQSIQETIRSWGLSKLSPLTMEAIAGKINATVRGWIDYYGAFYQSGLRRPLGHIDYHLIKWIMRKYKRFRGAMASGMELVTKTRAPKLRVIRALAVSLWDSFIQFQNGCMVRAVMSREAHVRFCESLGVKIPRAT